MLQTESGVASKANQETIRLHAIELFVIHLPKENQVTLCGFGDHYRIMMRMMTSRGCGWGEMYLNEGNRPSDWTAWASWYEQVLRRSFESVSSLENSLISGMRPNHLGRVQLLCDALQGLTGPSGGRVGIEAGQDERSLLISAAEAYVSLF